MESSATSTAPIRTYGKKNEPVNSSLDFGASALFGGGMTAKDFSDEEEEEEDEVEISLDEIKKRYLGKGVGENKEPVTQADTQKDTTTTTTQPVNLGDISKDTVDQLEDEENKSPDPTAVDLPSSPVEEFNNNNNENENVKAVGDDSEDDDDIGIIKHKKRPHILIDEEEENEENGSDGDKSIEDSDKGKDQKKKVKKLSKKEIEETEREAQRVRRNQELAPSARTENNASLEGFLNLFEKQDSSDISPHKTSDEDNNNVKNGTPPTSPPNVEQQDKDKDSFARTNLVTPRRLASYMQSVGKQDEKDDSDDDLDVVPTTQAEKRSKAMQKLAQLANVNPYKKRHNDNIYKRPSPDSKIGRRTFIEQITNKQREQAMKIRDEKIADFRARGGQLMTQSEKDKEEEMVESLLERERRKAEELSKQEKDEDDENDEDFVDEEEDEEVEEEEEDEEKENLDPEEEEEVNEIGEDEDVLMTQEKPEKDEKEVNNDEDENEPEFVSSQKETETQKDDFDMLESTQLYQFPDPTQSPASSPEPELELEPETQAVQEDKQDAQQVEREKEKEAEDDDDDEDQVKVGRRRLIKKEPVKPKVKYDKKKSAARGVVEDEAVESDDEWAGIGGEDEDGEDVDTYNLENLVDNNSEEKAVEAENQGLWAEKEKVRDEELVTKLMDDVTNGGWRRRRAANNTFDLSDDEDEDSVEKERQRREQQKRMKLLEDENLSNIANNPKAAAFIECIADKSSSSLLSTRSIGEDGNSKLMSAQDVRESLSFLDAPEDPEVMVSEEDKNAVLAEEDNTDTVEVATVMKSNSIKTIDRISARRTTMRERLEDPSAGPRSVASMTAKFKAEQGKKGVQVLRSLTGQSFSGSNKGAINNNSSSNNNSKRVLKPVHKKRTAIPKGSVSMNLFKQGGWE